MIIYGPETPKLRERFVVEGLDTPFASVYSLTETEFVHQRLCTLTRKLVMKTRQRTGRGSANF